MRFVRGDTEGFSLRVFDRTIYIFKAGSGGGQDPQEKFSCAGFLLLSIEFFAAQTGAKFISKFKQNKNKEMGTCPR